MSGLTCHFPSLHCSPYPEASGNGYLFEGWGKWVEGPGREPTLYPQAVQPLPLAEMLDLKASTPLRTLRIEGLELSSMEFAKGGKESDAKIPFPSEPLSFFFNLCQTVMLLSGLS